MEQVATTVKDVVISALTTIAGDMTGIISGVLPIALGVVGAGMVVVFGVKFFKKLIGKA